MIPRNLARTRISLSPSSALKRRNVFQEAAQQHVVENSGSIARDVLAAERTFLAWSRTGLGFVGAGSALFAAYHQNFSTRDDEISERTSQQKYYTYPASALLVGNGAFLLTFATRRYLRTIHYLMRDKFPIDTRGTLMAIVVTASSTLSSLGLVLYGEYQKNLGDANDTGEGNVDKSATAKDQTMERDQKK